SKAAFQTHVKLNFEHRALGCRACPTPGVCCTDAHFVNVNITRLEAVAIRETIARTPRLTEDERRAVYSRARAAVARYGLTASGDTFERTFACPLFVRGVGCLVHRRAKPAPCIQHACYKDWADVPPLSSQWRDERRADRLQALTPEHTRPNGGLMYCPNCGTESTQGLNYCNRCGNSLSAPAQDAEKVRPAVSASTAWAVGLTMGLPFLIGLGILFGSLTDLAQKLSADVVAFIMVCGSFTILEIGRASCREGG